MSSLTRRMQRNYRRRNGTWESPDRLAFAIEDGGYLVLLPTKGWMRMTGKRLRAQQRMAEMLGR